MIRRIVRGRGFIPIVLILAALLYWKVHPGSPKVISVGYVGDQVAILWNTLAQVREPVGEVHYGDRLEVIRVEGPAMQVPRGRTKTLSNVRVEPGRDGKRIFQFGRGTRVLILKRAVADVPQGPEGNSQEEKTTASAEEGKSKQEDWLLVLRAVNPTTNGYGVPSSVNGLAEAKPATSDSVSGGPVLTQSGSAAVSGPAGPIAGWVLARFIELDLPDPVKDYASSADLHVVAWFELDRVPDGSGGETPQYLVAGSHGGEGGPCDFTMLRVYTWGMSRKRYETAFVESNLCGKLPIQISAGAKGPEFQFPDVDEGGADRKYVMSQTSVRRVKEATSQRARTHH